MTAPGPRTWGPSWSWLLLALALAIATPLLWWWATPALVKAPAAPGSSPSETSQAPAASASRSATPLLPLRALPALATAAPPTAPGAASVAGRPAQRMRDHDGDLTPDLADVLNPGEQPTMAEVIARLNAAGVYSGLGAFQPPGTRPPLIGLAVPEDYALPPGYVRHHQVTDDGQRIEAILMFSPDHTWVDASGQPVRLPPDRVVPPELAPPGLPIRRIVVPTPVDPAR